MCVNSQQWSLDLLRVIHSSSSASDSGGGGGHKGRQEGGLFIFPERGLNNNRKCCGFSKVFFFSFFFFVIAAVSFFYVCCCRFCDDYLNLVELGGTRNRVHIFTRHVKKTRDNNCETEGNERRERGRKKTTRKNLRHGNVRLSEK